MWKKNSNRADRDVLRQRWRDGCSSEVAEIGQKIHMRLKGRGWWGQGLSEMDEGEPGHDEVRMNATTGHKEKARNSLEKACGRQNGLWQKRACLGEDSIRQTSTMMARTEDKCWKGT